MFTQEQLVALTVVARRQVRSLDDDDDDDDQRKTYTTYKYIKMTGRWWYKPTLRWLRDLRL